jgi:hypothetical protein
MIVTIAAGVPPACFVFAIARAAAASAFWSLAESFSNPNPDNIIR